MKTPSFLAPYIAGDSPTRLVQGLVVGAVATLAIGFGWANWHLDSTMEKAVADASEQATVAALAPICAARFQQAASTDTSLIPQLEAERSWERKNLLVSAGWATFAGDAEPQEDVAQACANLLNTSLKLS